MQCLSDNHRLFPHSWVEVQCLKEEVQDLVHPQERLILHLQV